MADSPLSGELSPPTCSATYAPFTPSDSGQRSHPLYYRGCWHRRSRCFLTRYRQSPRKEKFVPGNRGLQAETRHPPRGVAASDFRPLRKIPHCCLPWESGRFLSPNVAAHPLRPATRRRLGEPLPRQLADKPRAPRFAPEVSEPGEVSRKAYAVLPAR